MTGRGVDQILPFASDPRLYEPYVRSALRYVELAESHGGPIPAPVDFAYVWGDGLAALRRMRPDVRIINLETAVTTSSERAGKGIHYRMHPENTPCITAADIDCCVLANNHVLDWGRRGLEETLAALHGAGIRTAGAGANIGEARRPAVLPLAAQRRVLVFGLGTASSGIPADWVAAPDVPGVNRLGELSAETARRIAEDVAAVKRAGDIAVASIHWGGNWGYEIASSHAAFAHALIDEAGIDVVHGHSSHHPLGIEVYRGKLVLYGCGDLLNDYEGIGGYETYRDDLTLMYFASVAPATGMLADLTMVPFRISRMRLNRASGSDARWLATTLDRESRRLGSRVTLRADDTLVLEWG